MPDASRTASFRHPHESEDLDSRIRENDKRGVSGKIKSVVSCQLSVVRKASGFTLIELLIVITIIGILASLTLASYGNAQSKGRDGVRKSDLAQMKRALELAKSDCTGSAWYPVMPSFTSESDHYTKLVTYLSNDNLDYVSSVIQDPQNVSPQVYSYRTNAASGTADKCPSETVVGTLDKDGAAKYSLWVKLERATDAQSLDSRKKCDNYPGPGGVTETWSAIGVTHDGYFVICNN